MMRARIPIQTRTVIVMLTGELPRVVRKFVDDADAGDTDEVEEEEEEED